MVTSRPISFLSYGSEHVLWRKINFHVSRFVMERPVRLFVHSLIVLSFARSFSRSCLPSFVRSLVRAFVFFVRAWERASVLSCVRWETCEHEIVNSRLENTILVNTRLVNMRLQNKSFVNTRLVNTRRFIRSFLSFVQFFRTFMRSVGNLKTRDL